MDVRVKDSVGFVVQMRKVVCEMWIAYLLVVSEDVCVGSQVYGNVGRHHPIKETRHGEAARPRQLRKPRGI